MARTSKTFEPVTMAQLRAHGCRELLVYCGSPWCNHSAKLNGDWLPDKKGARPDAGGVTGFTRTLRDQR
jgi:hypothetical protein